MAAWDVKIKATREYSFVIESPTSDDAQTIAMDRMGKEPGAADETTFELEVSRRPS